MLLCCYWMSFIPLWHNPDIKQRHTQTSHMHSHRGGCAPVSVCENRHWQTRIHYVSNSKKSFVCASAHLKGSILNLQNLDYTCSVVYARLLQEAAYKQCKLRWVCISQGLNETHKPTHTPHSLPELSQGHWAVRGCKLGIPHLNHTTQLLVLHGAWTCMPLLLKGSSQLVSLLLFYMQLSLDSVYFSRLSTNHIFI